MKYMLKKEFKDILQPNETGIFYVNPDKEIFFGNKNQYPIIWTGILNNNSVKIILKNSDSFTIRSYDFVNYPKSESNLKETIVKWINEYINDKWK